MSVFSSIFTSVKQESFDLDLRKYMLNVYKYMSFALGLTACVAYLSAASGLSMLIFSSPLGILVSLSPIGIVLYLSSGFLKFELEKVKKLFFLYSGLIGLSISTVFLTYNAIEIIKAFFITSSLFLSMSIYGYVTKKDLTSMGSFFIMGAFGLFVASMINIFTRSSQLSYSISFLAVIIFTALTAYDTQKIKQIYFLQRSGNIDSGHAAKLSIFGAMQLYVDFIAIFIHLLNLLRGGSSRN